MSLVFSLLILREISPNQRSFLSFATPLSCAYPLSLFHLSRTTPSYSLIQSHLCLSLRLLLIILNFFSLKNLCHFLFLSLSISLCHSFSPCHCLILIPFTLFSQSASLILKLFSLIALFFQSPSHTSYLLSTLFHSSLLSLSPLLSYLSLIIRSPIHLLTIYSFSHMSLTLTFLLLSLLHSSLAFFIQYVISQIFSPIILSPFQLTLSRLPTCSINLPFSLSFVLTSFLVLYHRSLSPPPTFPLTSPSPSTPFPHTSLSVYSSCSFTIFTLSFSLPLFSPSPLLLPTIVSPCFATSM